MYWVGHAGLTTGLASAGTMFWIRKRIIEHLDELTNIPPVKQRVRQRGKYALAGLAFTGCATVVSGKLDVVEQSLGFTHRTGAHSLPLIGGVYSAAKLAKKKGIDFVRWVCNQAGCGERVKPVLDALEDLSSWILGGGLTGALTHILGDIPTLGQGATALSILYPITNRGANLGWIAAASPTLNSLAVKAGAILAATSWGVSAVYLTTPEPPKKLLKDKLADLIRETQNVVATDSLHKKAQDEARRLLKLLRETYEGGTSPASRSAPPSYPVSTW